LLLGFFFIFTIQRKIKMKYNTILLIAIITIAGSCGTPAGVTSKSTAKTSKELEAQKQEVAKAPTIEANKMPMTAALAEGKDLYENNCGKCHDLFKPKDFSKEAWAPILVSMQEKARLSDMQMANISNYIYAQL